MREKRVLVVEDDDDLRRLFRTVLSMAGFEVAEAGDGLAALRQVESTPPDVIVLDLKLRALDGISVQQELAARAITSRIPIVIVTGSDTVVEGVNVACILRKPITPDQLIDTVKSCMAKGVSASGT